MDICHKPYEGQYLLPYRVIADHARCLSFALSDGASFSNEGRGYVLRRIIRRAARYGQKLGIEEPFMHKLVDVVASYYGDFYPELRERADKVKKAILEEERRFAKTLKEGEAMLKLIKRSDTLILLDERGESFTSVQWAAFLEKQMIVNPGRDITFAIGGAYGFSGELYKRADGMVSLSKMTFSHQIVRLLFIEQLYRAFTIIKGDPYHHE